MARKFYGQKTFTATVNGHDYKFCCAGQDTNYGFRHVCIRYKDLGNVNFSAFSSSKMSRACYYNRTWESFKYETVLKKEIDRQDLPKEIKQEIYNQLILGIQKAEHEKAEKEIQQFKEIYNNCSDRQKQMLSNLPLMTSEEDVRSVKALMLLGQVMGV